MPFLCQGSVSDLEGPRCISSRGQVSKSKPQHQTCLELWRDFPMDSHNGNTSVVCITFEGKTSIKGEKVRTSKPFFTSENLPVLRTSNSWNSTGQKDLDLYLLQSNSANSGFVSWEVSPRFCSSSNGLRTQGSRDQSLKLLLLDEGKDGVSR